MTAIQEAVRRILDGNDLSAPEVSACIDEIVEGSATQAQIAGLLVGLRKKGETVEEVAAFASALRGHSVLKDRPVVKGRMVDTCGTGGDSVKTLNVSTISAFVAAGAGAVVAKHGGRSVTSRSGSADVLESLGFNLAMEPSRVKESVETLGIGFMFAPAFHPAMRQVAPVRKELGVRTVFNLMGPLINPARVEAQLLGLYSPALVGQVAAVLGRLGLEEAMVVHAAEGMDEISVTGKTLVSHLRDGRVATKEYAPRDFGVTERPTSPPSCPADAAEGALLAMDVLMGRAEARDCGLMMVLANSAACLVLAQKAGTFAEGVEMAETSIKSGRAMAKLEQVVKFSGGSLDGARERYARQKR
ncbi:MAG: anthranilate phosphoribosyltransferase [Nitrososphaerota archaeon]|nr:anthranilate phosphoribosyltransferase [Nitrososphaerota archaeon]